MYELNADFKDSDKQDTTLNFNPNKLLMNKTGSILLFSSDQGTEDVDSNKNNGVIII